MREEGKLEQKACDMGRSFSGWRVGTRRSGQKNEE